MFCQQSLWTELIKEDGYQLLGGFSLSKSVCSAEVFTTAQNIVLCSA